jgi:PAS domain S-box-containing protein/putative nucleotidyltransferase with HDIG domain
VELHLVYAALYAGVALLTVATFPMIWEHRAARDAMPLGTFMVGVAIWCGASAMMWLVPSVSQQLFWSRAENLGVWLVPVAFLTLAFNLARIDLRRTRGLRAAIAVVSFVVANLEWVNPGNLFDRSVVTHAIGSYTQYRTLPGPLYWVLVAFVYAVVIVACAIILRIAVRSMGAERRRALTVLAGGLAPLIASAVTVSGFVSLEFDPAPLAFLVTGSLWFMAVLSGDLLAVLPLARDLLVQQMLDGVVVIGPDGDIVDANPAAIAMLGASGSAVLGKPADVVFGHLTGVAELLAKDEAQATAVVPFGPGAAPGYLRIEVVPLVARAGARPARLLTLRDITGIRRAREQEARLAAVVTSSPDAIFTTDLEGVVRTWNAGAEAQYGYPAAEMIGASVALLIPPGGEAEVQSVVRTVLEEGHLANFESARRRRDGSLVEVLHSFAAVRDERGEVVAVSVIGHDVTERNRDERARRESDDKFETAFNASPDLISVTRRSDGTILEVNDGYQRMLGYTRAESVGRNTSELALWAKPADRDAFTRKLAGSGEVKDFETRLRRKDGTIIDVSISARGFELHGEECMLSVVHDITSRKQTENNLRTANLRFETMVRGVAEAMGRVVEARDPYTQGHQVRVARIGKSIAEEMGLSGDEVDGIEMAGLVHDIGKLAVPAEILSKPGRITDVEFALIQEHPQVGYEILKGIDFPWPVADIVLAHHERQDGSGYPDHVAGADIAIAARILGVADVVEAMSSYRPYRPALGSEAAIAELETHAERYDPTVVAAFLARYERGEIEI